MRTLIPTAMAAMMAAMNWVAVTGATLPVSATIAALALTRPAHAATAVLPGWHLSCGRNPRCFERGEARRQRARLRREMGGI
jgi:hypothetical protein